VPSFWQRLFRLNARFLIRQLEALFPGPPIGGAVIFKTRRSISMGEIVVKDDETTLRASITLLDAEGQPTTADDIPTWEVGDDSVLTVHPADDGLSATFDVGSPGASSVTVTTNETHDGEGDPTPIVLTGLVTVIAGDTVSGSVDFATG
jgi:hypothetical protein